MSYLIAILRRQGPMASINPMGRMTAHRNHTVANEITTESTGSRFTHTMTVDIRTQASVAAKAVTRVSCQGNHHHQRVRHCQAKRFTLHTYHGRRHTYPGFGSCQGSHQGELPGQPPPPEYDAARPRGLRFTHTMAGGLTLDIGQMPPTRWQVNPARASWRASRTEVGWQAGRTRASWRASRPLAGPAAPPVFWRASRTQEG